ncbi:MAG: bifunctional UDP-N-acetylmuramoyl-tripeptide:D-alanyl-D-alanine ligase/alanine racemase, partial [Bacteroidetes bacterium]
MFSFTISEIAGVLNAELVKGQNFTDRKIGQIVTDSRTYFKGENSLFFALTGPRNNGHLYISNLIEKGLTAFVVSDSSVISSKATFLLVEDTTSALQKLAAFNRQKYNYPVIGITGSNGKTIVKEWLYHILSGEFKIVRNPKSYNSQVGVPLSVLLMEAGYELGIFEAGISQPGEMKNLAEIIRPTLGIFTNIGDAHQEGFVSAEQKAEEKLLLFAN